MLILSAILKSMVSIKICNFMLIFCYDHCPRPNNNDFKGASHKKQNFNTSPSQVQVCWGRSECFGCLTLSEAHTRPPTAFQPAIVGSSSLLGRSSPSSSAELWASLSRSKTSEAWARPAGKVVAASAGEGATITRQATTDQTTDRDRAGQTEEFHRRR